jgi:hypothetical protein
MGSKKPAVKHEHNIFLALILCEVYGSTFAIGSGEIRGEGRLIIRYH